MKKKLLSTKKKQKCKKTYESKYRGKTMINTDLLIVPLLLNFCLQR